MPDTITLHIPYKSDSGKDLNVPVAIPKNKVKLSSDGKTLDKNQAPGFEDYVELATQYAARAQYPTEFGLPGGNKTTKYNVTDPRATTPLDTSKMSLPDKDIAQQKMVRNVTPLTSKIPSLQPRIPTPEPELSPLEHLGRIGSAYIQATNPLNIMASQAHALQDRYSPEDMQAPIPHNIDEAIGGYALPMAVGSSPKIRAGGAGAVTGAAKELFSEGRWRSIPAYRGLVAALLGGELGYRIGGGQGAAVGGAAGAGLSALKGAITGAKSAMAGQPWLEPSIQGFFSKTPGKPSPAVRTDVNVSSTQPQGPPSYAAGAAPVQQPTQISVGQPQTPSPAATPQIEAAPNFTIPGYAGPRTNIPPTQPALPAGQQPLQITGPSEMPLRSKGGLVMPPVPGEETYPIERTAKPGAVKPRTVEKPAVQTEQKPLMERITGRKVEKPAAEKPAQQKFAEPKEAETRVEANKLLGFLAKRKGASISELQEQFGVSKENLTKQLNSLAEDNQVHKESGKWHEGKAKTVKKPGTEGVSKESIKNIMEKMKGKTSEAKSEKTGSEPLAQSKETKKYDFSHEEIGKLADSLGVNFTSAARWLEEGGYNVQPSKFIGGKYGLKSGKKDVSIDEKKAKNILELMKKSKN